MGRETITTQFARMEPLILDLIRRVVGDFNNTGGDTLGGPYAIRLYDESVQKVREYSHDDAGLEAALGAAAAGDTIWLPPGTVAGNHTIPDGIEVTGCGINTVLSGVITNANTGILSNLKLSGTLTNSGYTYNVVGPAYAASFVGGASLETDAGSPYVTLGGFNNRVRGGADGATVFGYGSETYGEYDFIVGKNHDSESDGYDLIGGDTHTVGAGSSHNVIGGETHLVTGTHNLIAGDSHPVSGNWNLVAGQIQTVTGHNNTAGGMTNAITGDYNALFGSNNTITGDLNFIGGGDSNTITDSEAAILTAYQGVITGYMAVILGGNGVNLSGDYSLGWGNHPTVTHSGAALFADGNYAAPAFPSVANNEFAVRARGGIRLVTDIDVAGATTYAVGMYTGAELRFYEGANYVGFEPPALTGNQIWILPDADGAANEVIYTDGAGTLAWGDIPTLAGMAWVTNANVVNLVTDTDTVTIGSATAGGKLFIDGDADEIQLQVQAVAGQSANLVELQRSDSTLTAGFDERGVLFSHGGTGATNLFAGDNAGSLTAAGYNTALGENAGQALAAGGTYNTLVGSSAGYELTTGDYNVFIGRQAGMYGQDATGNTFVGYYAGRGTAVYDVYNNTFIGFNAGYSNASGDNNIFIGAYAGWRQTNNSNLLIVDYTQRADVATELSNAILYGVMAAAPANQSLRINALVEVTGNVYPITDDTYYLGKNDDDSPQAWKGLILKDQTTGTYYRLQIDSGAVNLVDLTD